MTAYIEFLLRLRKSIQIRCVEQSKKITTLQSYFTPAEIEEMKELVPNKGAYIRAKARCHEVRDDALRLKLEQLGALVEMEAVSGR